MKTTDKTYNGHKNWQYWNVALWIGNDEGLYNLARDCRRQGHNLSQAAELFLQSVGTEQTPDGAKWTKSAVSAAIQDL